MKVKHLVLILFVVVIIVGSLSISFVNDNTKIETPSKINKLIIPSNEVGTDSIVYENIKDFKYYFNSNYISFKKDNKKYIYRGEYMYVEE